MKKYVFASIVVSALTLISACGGGGSSGASTIADPYDGTFVGTEAGTSGGVAFSQTVIFTLEQSGSSLTGTWTNNAGTANGNLSGTVSGNDATITITQNQCAGSLTGTSTISGSTMTATISGNLAAPCGGAVSASVVASK